MKKSLAILFSLIGLIGFSFANSNEFRLLFYSFIVTPVFISIDYLFKYLSIKKHNRDLNLWLNYSDDVDGVYAPFRHPKFKTTDVLFSILLLFLIVGLVFFGITLFGKDNLYNQIIN